MTVSFSTRSARMASQAMPHGRGQSALGPRGATRGIFRAASSPQADRAASRRPPIHSGGTRYRAAWISITAPPARPAGHDAGPKDFAAWRIAAPATIPPSMARFEPISIRPLAAESRWWGTSSGMIPYLAGPNRAACTPSRPRITSAQRTPFRPGDQHRDAREHQRQLEDLGADDERPLADAVGQHARRHRDQQHRDDQDDLGDRRMLLTHLGGGGRGDRQEDHDLLPGVVVERAQELGHEQPAHRMLRPDADHGPDSRPALPIPIDIHWNPPLATRRRCRSRLPGRTDVPPTLSCPDRRKSSHDGREWTVVPGDGRETFGHARLAGSAPDMGRGRRDRRGAGFVLRAGMIDDRGAGFL